MAVSVDFEELRSTADDFRTNSDELMDVINDSESLLNNLVDQGFEGATSDAFIAKFEELRPSLEAAAELLEQIGGALDDTAQSFEDMDNDLASSIAG